MKECSLLGYDPSIKREISDSRSKIKSDRPADCADFTRSGRMRFPRFNLTDVGSSSLISFANADSRAEGSREVVTDTGRYVIKLWAVLGFCLCTYPKHEGLPRQIIVHIHHRDLAVLLSPSRERSRHTDNLCARLCRWRWKDLEVFPRPKTLLILLFFRQFQHLEGAALFGKDNLSVVELACAVKKV